jgi:hypothetical protein
MVDSALLALRKKKYQTGLLEKTEGQMLNLEEMVLYRFIITYIQYEYARHYLITNPPSFILFFVC